MYEIAACVPMNYHTGTKIKIAFMVVLDFNCIFFQEDSSQDFKPPPLTTLTSFDDLDNEDLYTKYKVCAHREIYTLERKLTYLCMYVFI